MHRRYGMRPHDWAFLAAIAFAGLGVAALMGGRVVWAIAATVIAGAAAAAARRWSRRYPGPMPYVLRSTLFLLPHAPAQLRRLLGPTDGERMLEIGPGVGHHALPIASALGPNGVLHVLDVQQEMLDALIRRARAAGISNIVAQQGDAQDLPYPDGMFDGAYLSAVLGEVPDQALALRELHRVLKPNGRLVVAEGCIDPDYINLATLRAEAGRAGFVLEKKLGSSVAYLALFRAEKMPRRDPP